MISGILGNIPRYAMGSLAIIMSLLLLFHHPPTGLIAILSIYLVAICVIDTLHSKIPNFCNLSLLIAGFSYNVYLNGFSGLGQSILGFFLGLSFLMVPYLLGGMGGGDVKALAAMGALLGPEQVFQVFLYIGLVGGAFAILHYLFQKNLWIKIRSAGRALLAFLGTHDVHCCIPKAKERMRFPYAAAIAFGVFFYTNYGGIFPVFKNLLGQVI